MFWPQLENQNDLVVENRQRRILRFLRAASVLVFSCLICFSCGKKNGKESNVSFSMIPSSPVVINADLDFPDPTPDDNVDQSISVTAPWFKFKYKVTNNSNDTVTLVSLSLKYRSTLKGATVQGEGTFSGTDLPGDLAFLAEVPPGDEDTPNVAFYLGGLPESDSYIFHIEATMIGWFGTANSPRERFEKVVRFRTQ